MQEKEKLKASAKAPKKGSALQLMRELFVQRDFPSVQLAAGRLFKEKPKREEQKKNEEMPPDV